MNKKNKVYNLMISLNDWSPKIWRKIWIKDNTRLDKLAEILYTSMDWSGSHLSEIRTKNYSYGDTSPEDAEEMMPEDWLDYKDYTFKHIADQQVTQFHFCYDFGDNWEMTVKIKYEPGLATDAPYPVCVNGKNAAPPEDVGSYSGFEKFIKVINNPKSREYKEISDWWGDDSFDSTYFSSEDVNAQFDGLDYYEDFDCNKFIPGRSKKLEIDQESLKNIFIEDYKDFFLSKTVNNCYCSKCNNKYSSVIINYQIYLNDLDDILLEGYCAKCNSQIGRYIETGEVEKYKKMIIKVRKYFRENKVFL